MSENKKVRRTCNWMFIGYPESLPDDWFSYLDSLHIAICVSPLHDKDLDDDGFLKKPHYHVLMQFDSLKSFEQIKEIVVDRLHQPLPERIESMRSQVRYTIHADHQDKAQYLKSDVRLLGGFDYEKYFNLMANDRYQAIADMMDYIDENGIVEFKDLMDYARKNRFDDWFRLLSDSCSYVMDMYIKSCRHYKN